MLNRAVFLDRDGVLNHAVVRDGKLSPPSNLAELKVFPDAASALGDLRKLGFLLIVITNQPDVARGTQDRSVVEAINAALSAQLPIDDFFTCYHDDCDGCDCRKPLPGLIHQAVEKYAISLPGSFLIGDRWRDIGAGLGAGCTTILIESGYDEGWPVPEPHARVRSLGEATGWISKRMSDSRATLMAARRGKRVSRPHSHANLL